MTATTDPMAQVRGRIKALEAQVRDLSARGENTSAGAAAGTHAALPDLNSSGHPSSIVSVDPTGLAIVTTTDVQAAIAELDARGLPVETGSPAAPAGFTVTPGPLVVSALWTANTESDVRRGFGQYRVQVGPPDMSVVYGDFLTSATGWTFALPAGVTLGFRVAAIDWQGNQGAWSAILTGAALEASASNGVDTSATTPAALSTAGAGPGVADALARADHIHPTTGLSLSTHVHTTTGVTLAVGKANVFAAAVVTSTFTDLDWAMSSTNTLNMDDSTAGQVLIPEAEVGNALLFGAMVRYGMNATGRRHATLEWKPATSGAWQAFGEVAVPSVGAAEVTFAVFPMLMSDAGFASASDDILVRCRVWQNSGVNLQVQGQIAVVRVA